MSGRNRWSLMALALITASVAIAGVASATNNDVDQTYTACLSSSGQLARVAVGEEPVKECSTKQTEVSWNSHGPIVMTTSGNAWFPHGQFYVDRVEPYERWATETVFFVPVRAVIGLTGPGSVDGVDYGLESFDLCVITDSNYVSSVSVTGIAPFGPDVDDDQYLNLFHEAFAPPGLTTGCHTFVVNAAVGQGAGLMVEVTDISDGSPVTLSSVKSVWTPEAAQP